ncbi:hypothetical protein [Blastococcus sp. TF02A-30]|uniref:hypothetical protein n=1 Tax=Blastococcus sp. TF02A-30 TaxID=2250580 RepID=UPI000DEA633F|nr:hypothetical protein [Blastococcus sp. TF02A-30]RBY91214.1 hypothetical protein DQ241_06005 [Blastococcus sp. TF02A-30]
MHPLVAPQPRLHLDTADGLVALRTVDDLHDADLDLVLADRLADSAAALRAAVEVVRATALPGALAAHRFPRG